MNCRTAIVCRHCTHRNFLCERAVSHRNSYRGADKSLARPGRKQANVSFRMAWISFGVLPCRKKKKELDDSSRLDVVEIARVSDMLRACFLPGRAKDLSAPRYLNNINLKIYELLPWNVEVYNSADGINEAVRCRRTVSINYFLLRRSNCKFTLTDSDVSG